MVVCLGLVLFAVGVEVHEGGQGAGLVSSGWHRFLPNTWPQPLRASWWLLIGGASGVFRAALDSLDGGRRPGLAVLWASPFVIFGLGVLAGQQWATWH